MTLTVRLPADLDEQLRSRASSQGVKVSDFVRQAIAEKLEREPAKKHSPYELGKDVLGRDDGPEDLSTHRMAYMADYLAAVRECVLGRIKQPTNLGLESLEPSSGAQRCA